MRNLLHFIVRFHVFFLFLLLQGIAWSLIVSSNHYQRSSSLNAANQVYAGIHDKVHTLTKYVNLDEVNDSLSLANAQLLAQIKAYKKLMEVVPPYKAGYAPKDSVLLNSQVNYRFISAKVLNNTIHHVNNFMVLDKGSKDGIRPEMGVVSHNGIVGVVKDVSANYANVLSVLHKGLLISSRLKTSHAIGSLQWEPGDPEKAILVDVAKSVPISLGDTVVTSGYSSIFPPDIVIGTVVESDLAEGSNFYDIKVQLSTNFRKLNYVYVVDYLDIDERKAIEQAATN